MVVLSCRVGLFSHIDINSVVSISLYTEHLLVQCVPCVISSKECIRAFGFSSARLHLLHNFKWLFFGVYSSAKSKIIRFVSSG